jgi:hypothetical protein
VVTEGGDSFAVEDVVYTDFQLFLARQALGGNELKAFARDTSPLVYLFGHPGRDMSGINPGFQFTVVVEAFRPSTTLAQYA